MNLETLQEILINYVPYFAAIIAFLASGTGFLRKLSEILKKSNLDDIKSQIHDENSSLSKKVDELIEMYKTIADENAKLKKQNNELLGELKRIADYEYKED